MRQIPLSEYLERWSRQDLEDLLRYSTAPFLVETGVHRPVEHDGLGAQAGFRTGEIDLQEVQARQLSPAQRAVFVLEKRREGVFSELISVGRTPNLDVPLPRPGISKFHAHFSQLSQGLYALTDKESTNGTFVRGVRLEPNTPTELEDGVEVRFATYCFRFLSPRSFAQLLARFGHGRT